MMTKRNKRYKLYLKQLLSGANRLSTEDIEDMINDAEVVVDDAKLHEKRLKFNF